MNKMKNIWILFIMMNNYKPPRRLASFLLYLFYPYEMPFLYGGKGRYNSNDDDWDNGIQV